MPCTYLAPFGEYGGDVCVCGGGDWGIPFIPSSPLNAPCSFRQNIAFISCPTIPLLSLPQNTWQGIVSISCQCPWWNQQSNCIGGGGDGRSRVSVGFPTQPEDTIHPLPPQPPAYPCPLTPHRLLPAASGPGLCLPPYAPQPTGFSFSSLLVPLPAVPWQ